MTLTLLGLLKTSWSFVSKPVTGLLRLQVSRRGAQNPPDGIADSKPEIDEALAVLAGGQGMAGLPTEARAFLSGRPDTFGRDTVQRWVADPRIRAALRTAATRSNQGLPVEDLRMSTLAVWEEVTLERREMAAGVFEAAVAFIRLSLGASLSPADRITIDNANANREVLTRVISDGLAPVHRRLAEVSQIAGLNVPVRLLDAHVLSGILRARRRRGFVEADEAMELVRLAEQSRDGDLRRATDGVRVSLFRAMAAALARGGDIAAARGWLEAARGLVPATDLTVDRARLDLVAGDADAALRAVRDGTGPEARLIMLAAAARREGVAAALALFRDRGWTSVDLDGAGLAALAQWMIDQGDLAEVLETLSAASPAQVHDAPVILFMRARSAISTCLPAAGRAGARLDLAFLPPPEIMRDDADARETLRAVHRDAANLRVEAEALGLTTVAAKALEMEVWAGLATGDPALADGARARLSAMMAEVPPRPAGISLACAFGIPFDRDAAARRLDEDAGLGGWGPEQAMAALDLALSSDQPTHLLDLLQQRWVALAAHIVPAWLQAIRIEALVRVGRTTEARQALEEGSHWDSPQGDEFRRSAGLLVDRASGQDVIGRLEAAFAERGDPADLIHLVEALRAARDGAGLARRLPELWRLRRRVEDAREACAALERMGDNGRLSSFLEEIGAEVTRDRVLGLFEARSRANAGDFAGTASTLARLERDGASGRDLRAIRIDVAMESGAWDDLHRVIGDDLNRADDPSAAELVSSARIGQAIGSRYESELVDRAVAKAPDDPHVLLAAYLASVKRGEEATDPRASDWLRRSAELSGKDGPVRAEALPEAAEIIRAQREQARSLSEMAVSGDLPLTLVIGRLNLTLSELMLGVLPRNADRDPAHRLPLPLFAAGRPLTDLTDVDVIGLDPGALLLQAHLGLLETTLATFGRVVVPAGTLTTLLDDMGRLRIQQPSQVTEARQIVAALDAGRLQILPRAGIDARLAREAGEAFAYLAAGVGAGRGRLVHVPPVPRAGSHLVEAVDLGDLDASMTDVSAILECLSRFGALEPEAEAAFRSRLARAGATASWLGVTALAPSDELVLDDIALHYVVSCGALAVVLATFATVWVGPWVAERARAMLLGAAGSERIIADVEALRRTLAGAIASGKVVVAPRVSTPAKDETSSDGPRTPLESLVTEPGPSQALVLDDRHINAWSSSVGRDGRSLPIASTLDVVEALVARGAIDEGRRRSVRHRLRRSGALLVPVDASELASFALRPVSGDNVASELRAVADGVGLAMIRGAVRRPRDLPWLGGLSLAVLDAIRICWCDAPDTVAAVAAGERLLDVLPRPAEWCPPQEGGDDGWRGEAEGLVLLSLSRSLPGTDRERRRAYAAWVDARVVGPLRASDPVTFDAVVDGKKENLLEMILSEIPADLTAGLDAGTVRAARMIAARDLIAAMPRLMRERLLEDGRVRSLCGLSATLALGRSGVPPDALVRLASDYLAGRASDPVTGATGAAIDVTVEERAGSLTLTLNGEICVVPQAGVLSEVLDVRLETIEDAFRRFTLAGADQVRLHDAIAAAVPDAAGYVAFLRELDASPQGSLAAISHGIATGRSGSAEDIVPASDATFLALVGERADAASPADLARGGFRSAVRLATARDAAGGLAFYAPCFVSRSMSLIVPASDMAAADVLTAVARMHQGGDPFGLLAALDLCAAHSSKEGFVRAGEAILGTLASDVERSTKLFCAAAYATVGVLARRGGLAAEPVFHRRLAALAWAGHVARLIVPLDVDVDAFLDGAVLEFSPEVSATVGRDRVTDPAWLPDWLFPEIMAAHVRARAEEIVQALGADAPEAWTALMAWDGPGQAAQLQAMLPGPMDGMDTDRSSRPSLDGDDVTAIIRRIDDVTNGTDCGLAVATFAVVDETERPRLREAVLRRLANSAFGAGQWTDGARMSLHLAALWKDKELADAALRCLPVDDGPSGDRPDPMRLALDAAASAADATDWRSRIGVYLDLVCSARLERWQARALDRGITTLGVGDPALAGALASVRHRARMWSETTH